MTTYLYTAGGPYTCQACNMSFTSTPLLAKHRARFCIGDGSDVVLIRKCVHCHELRCHCSDSPEVDELRALKDRRSRNREVRDFEERILLDNLEETECQLNGTPINTHRKKFPLSKHEDIRQLQIEYERMREEEKGMNRDLRPVRCNTRCSSDASMSIHLVRDRSKYNPSNDPKLHTLAENHGKQMEFLSNRNRDLERQRDEIRRRLGDLGRKPPEGDNTAALLAELRDQEARNQRLLDELKKQLLASRQPVAIISDQQPVQQKKSYTYPVYYGNSLVAEISAIRQAYIQSGGNDPEILAQLAQMLAEAQAIEEAMRNRKPPEPKRKEKKTTEITSHVMTLDLENERLNRELMLLQDQNLVARNRRKDDREVLPVTVINYPSRCEHHFPPPRHSRTQDLIILESGNNNSGVDGSGNCHICSAYFNHIPFSSTAMESDPFNQPYNYSQHYGTYNQQQQTLQQQPTVQPTGQQTARATTVAHAVTVAPASTVAPSIAPSIAPPTMAPNDVGHPHHHHLSPSASRAPSVVPTIVHDDTGSAREHKSLKSHRSRKSHKSHR